MAAIGFGAFAFARSVNVEVYVYGKAVEVPKGTTYSELREQGYLQAGPGDFLAIDGSVLAAGWGHPPMAIAEGRPVEDLGSEVVHGISITDERGADVVEPTISLRRVVPAPAVLAAGDSFQFFGKTLHMPLVPGEDGLEFVKKGMLSGTSAPGGIIEEAVPAVYGDYRPFFGDDRKVVAFTYDDGPDPTYTRQILDVLDKHGVKATFFMLGTSVESYPDIAREVADEGHQVASHSYSHAPECFLNKLDAEGAAYQIATAQAVIREATGVEARSMRPPGGNLDSEAVLAGAPWVDAYVGWDIGTGDFSKPGVDYIVSAVLDNMHPGGIVLMHDGGGDRTQTVEASDILIEELLDQGYSFVTIDELIEMTREEETGD